MRKGRRTTMTTSPRDPARAILARARLFARKSGPAIEHASSPGSHKVSSRTRANAHMPRPCPRAVHPKLRVAAISIASNAGLVTTELGVALSTGSLAVLADAFHSGVDLTGSLVALAGIRMALRASDRRHAYGYGRYENAAALVQFVLIAIIGVTVIQEAARRALSGFRVEVTPLVLGVILATIAADVLLFLYIARRGTALRSSALEADAYHFGTDALGKVGVIVA